MARRAAMKLEKLKKKLEMGSDCEDSGDEKHHHMRTMSRKYKKSSGGADDTHQQNTSQHDEELDDSEDDLFTDDEDMQISPTREYENGQTIEAQVEEEHFFNPLLEFAEILRLVKAQKLRERETAAVNK